MTRSYPLPAPTPMERDYPTICKWVRHQTVSTDRLREEIKRALAWLDEESYEQED